MSEKVKCPECGGTGKVPTNLSMTFWKDCPTCHGTGFAPTGEGLLTDDEIKMELDALFERLLLHPFNLEAIRDMGIKSIKGLFEDKLAAQAALTAGQIRNDVADYIDAAIKQMREATEKLEGKSADQAKAIMGVILDRTLKTLGDSIRKNDLTIQDDTGKTIWTVESRYGGTIAPSTEAKR